MRKLVTTFSSDHVLIVRRDAFSRHICQDKPYWIIYPIGESLMYGRPKILTRYPNPKRD